MNLAEATESLGRLKSAWPRNEMLPETTKTWLEVLAEYDADDVDVAIGELIRNEKWMPSIAQLRAAVTSVRREVQHRWACHPDCDRCGGLTLQVDDKGRDWLCPDAVWTTVRPAVVPGAGSASDHTKFLAAARGLLPAMKGPR